MESKVLKDKMLVAVTKVLKSNKFDLTEKVERIVRKAIKKITKKINKPFKKVIKPT
jgi:hypothetical protein